MIYKYCESIIKGFAIPTNLPVMLHQLSKKPICHGRKINVTNP